MLCPKEPFPDETFGSLGAPDELLDEAIEAADAPSSNPEGDSDS